MATIAAAATAKPAAPTRPAVRFDRGRIDATGDSSFPTIAAFCQVGTRARFENTS